MERVTEVYYSDGYTPDDLIHYFWMNFTIDTLGRCVDLEITASYPAGRIGTTAENLLAAAKGENEEWDVLYPDFAKVAEEEGFPEIANAFKQISKVEAEHERRYLKLLSRITDGNFFKRDGKIWWQCRNCGFICEAEEAPKICPACQHPQAYFEPKKDNY